MACYNSGQDHSLVLWLSPMTRKTLEHHFLLSFGSLSSWYSKSEDNEVCQPSNSEESLLSNIHSAYASTHESIDNGRLLDAIDLDFAPTALRTSANLAPTVLWASCMAQCAAYCRCSISLSSLLILWYTCSGWFSVSSYIMCVNIVYLHVIENMGECLFTRDWKHGGMSRTWRSQLFRV
jgi:hypothetical protein